MNAEIKQETQEDSVDVSKYCLTVEVGDSLSPYGLTRVTLEGTGKFQAEQVYEVAVKGESKRARDRIGPPEGGITGKLGASEAKQLLRTVSQVQWVREFPPRLGIPDEAVVKWSLRKNGEDSLEMKTWIQDAEKDFHLGPLLAQLREELARLSEGKFFL
jgi:hypothetical protein